MEVMDFSSFKMQKRLQVLNWQMHLNKCGRNDGLFQFYKFMFYNNIVSSTISKTSVRVAPGFQLSPNMGGFQLVFLWVSTHPLDQNKMQVG